MEGPGGDSLTKSRRVSSPQRPQCDSARVASLPDRWSPMPCDTGGIDATGIRSSLATDRGRLEPLRAARRGGALRAARRRRHGPRRGSRAPRMRPVRPSPPRRPPTWSSSTTRSARKLESNRSNGRRSWRDSHRSGPTRWPGPGSWHIGRVRASASSDTARTSPGDRDAAMACSRPRSPGTPR